MTSWQGQAETPNLIIILTDDQGYADVGFNGSTEIPTPHIDRIAHEGMRFTDAYVTYPVCSPSRAGMLTGRYQGHFGFRRNPTLNPADPMAGLPLEEDTIAEILSQIGYRSAIIGKWHLGTHKRLRPNQHGFHEFFGFLSGGHHYFPEDIIFTDIESVTGTNGWYRTKLLRNERRVEIDDYLTDELSDEAVAFVTRNRHQPFFLFLSYNAPHTPLEATPEYLARFSHIENERRRIYAAMISAVDDGVGRLLAKLDELELAENTLVFFLSDNGGATFHAADNSPLRGHKGQLYEGGVRVPFAARWPGRIPAGVDYSHPISSMDILGTIVGLTGAPISPERPLDGVNLMPYLTGEKKGPPHEVLFWHMYDRNRSGLRKGSLKLVIPDHGSPPELYELSDDISEAHLLRHATSIEKELLQELEAWKSQMLPPIFDPLGTWKP